MCFLGRGTRALDWADEISEGPKENPQPHFTATRHSLQRSTFKNPPQPVETKYEKSRVDY